MTETDLEVLQEIKSSLGNLDLGPDDEAKEQVSEKVSYMRSSRIVLVVGYYTGYETTIHINFTDSSDPEYYGSKCSKDQVVLS